MQVTVSMPVHQLFHTRFLCILVSNAYIVYSFIHSFSHSSIHSFCQPVIHSVSQSSILSGSHPFCQPVIHSVSQSSILSASQLIFVAIVRMFNGGIVQFMYPTRINQTELSYMLLQYCAFMKQACWKCTCREFCLFNS